MPETFSLNHHISDIMQDYIKELDFKCQHPNELRGISMGYDRLDERMGGLKAGEVTLIGARPAMGKTAFALNLAYNMAASFEARHTQNKADDKCVVYIALELPPNLFAKKMLALQSLIPFYKLNESADICENFNKIMESGRALNHLPLYYVGGIYDVDEIENILLKSEKQIGCVIIDHLQMLGGEDYSREDYSLIMLQIKALAAFFNVPVIVLTQLKRELELRADKRPLCSDIRGFSKNQNAADNILFLYRENYYICYAEPQKYKRETDKHFKMRFKEWQTRSKETEKLCEVIIAKNANGRYGTVKLYFDFATGLFAPWQSDFDELLS